MTHPSSQACPFCDPAIQAATFAESDRFRAAYNLAPVLPGHSLVIPRRHVESLLDLTDEEAAEMMLFSRQVVKRLGKAFHTDAFDWTIQDGIPAGQTVAHLHMHLIPRKTADLPAPGDWYPRLAENEKDLSGAIDSESRRQLSFQEMERIVEFLRKNEV